MGQVDGVVVGEVAVVLVYDGVEEEAEEEVERLRRMSSCWD